MIAELNEVFWFIGIYSGLVFGSLMLVVGSKNSSGTSRNSK